MSLDERRCIPCEGGIPKLTPQQIEPLYAQLRGWDLQSERLRKVFDFKNFIQAMAFVDGMARVAEQEQHHPDFCVHYRRVIVFLWTHALNGLSENDFILASKIDKMREEVVSAAR
jgi:4a-hydroxytetrahydrobiopterin dehydratase